MKIEKILKMKINEFEKELTWENWEYVSKDGYMNIINTLESYQSATEEAKRMGSYDFPNPNEYINNEREEMESFNLDLEMEFKM